MKIDFREIFRIADDGIYCESGKIDFANLMQVDGYFGEENQGEDCFFVEFYVKQGCEKIVVNFPYSAFSNTHLKVAGAKSKISAFCLYLSEKKIMIKSL